MIPIPLDQLRPRWHDHSSALWWLGLLYRRPVQFQRDLEHLAWSQGLRVALWLWLHLLPYVVCLWIIEHFLFGYDIEFGEDRWWPVLFLHALGIAGGIASGVVLGIASGIASGSALGIASGIASGVTFAIAFEIAIQIFPGFSEVAVVILAVIAIGIAGGIGGGIASGVARVIAFGITIGLAVGTAADLGDSAGEVGRIAFGIGGIAFGIGILRLYYYPLHLVFYWLKLPPRWYPLHPIAWDDLCAVPFVGFDHLLVAYAEHAPEVGAVEIDRLITSYPSQRTAALRAQVTLLAREAGRVTDLTQLDGIVARLPEGTGGFLSETPRIRERVHDIAHVQMQLDTMNRPILREPTAHLLCTEIENFRNQLGGFHEPLAREFRAAACRWLEIAQQQWDDAKALLIKEPSPQVFRAGDPVDRDKEAFVPRYSVLGDLEKQLLLSTGCPGIVLYGRRRMGKSTILRNLSGFVPPSVQPVLLSMQHPEAFTSMAHFMGQLADLIRQVLPVTPPLGDTPTDLAGLFHLLAACNKQCEATGTRLVLAVDEYEYIDSQIGAGVFSADLLATVRESIQSHRGLTWVFAGSHEITELPHAAWSSYLVSARTIEVLPFTLAETRLLLTEPLRHSSLWSKEAPGRPHFPPEFWGEGGIERIHHEAGGWPHLVQLIAETTIDLLNDAHTRQVDAALLERALDQAIVRGHTVLYQLLCADSTLAGDWDYLSAFRSRMTQPPPASEAVYTSLRRRLLVESANGEWRLRVPLMARWLRVRG